MSSDIQKNNTQLATGAIGLHAAARAGHDIPGLRRRPAVPAGVFHLVRMAEYGGVDRTTIGFFSWIGITYSIKVFWAPVVDRLPLRS